MNREEALNLVLDMPAANYNSVARVIEDAEKLLNWVNKIDKPESDQDRADRIWATHRDSNRKIAAIKELRGEFRAMGAPTTTTFDDWGNAVDVPRGGLLNCKNLIDDAVRRNPAPLF